MRRDEMFSEKSCKFNSKLLLLLLLKNITFGKDKWLFYKILFVLELEILFLVNFGVEFYSIIEKSNFFILAFNLVFLYL